MGERQRHRYWLWLGLTSFGGPGAQIAALQAEVVERRGWLTSEQFGRALGLCFFLPGPEAQQMVTWVAWKLDGWRAALLASLSFILPGLIGCGLFGWAYVSYGMLPAVEGTLAGVRAVVAGIIFISAWRLASSSFKGWGQGVASLVAFLGLSFGVPFGAVAIGSGLVGWWAVKPEENEATATAVPGLWRRLGLGLLPFVLLGLALCFLPGVEPGYAHLAGVSAFAVLTSFGGAYAALSLWRTQADAAGWLPAERFGDALVVGEATPGPLMLAGSFIGFVAGYHGHLGGGAGWLPAMVGLLIPAVFTFGISTAMILGTAPLGEIGVASPRFRGAMSFVTATAAGALAWMGGMLVMGLGGRPVLILLAIGAALVTQRRWLGVLPLLAIGAAVGWVMG